MVDFAKKVRRHRKSDLLSGETVHAAVFGAPLGSSARLFGTQLGGLGAGVLAAAIVKVDGEPIPGSEPATGPHTLAAKVSQKQVVATLTSQRVLFFGHGALTGRPKGLVAAFNFDQIERIGLQPGKFINNVGFQFTDSSVIEIEVTRLNDPDGFVRVWESIRP